MIDKKKIIMSLNGIDEKKKSGICVAAVILLAVIRYFFRLLARPCFYYDEVVTLKIVQGLWNTGKLYQWDYIHNCLSETAYTRAWPYTYLLCGWMKIFGFSLLSARALSAVLGVIFLISLFYIVEKTVNRKTAMLTVVLMLANNEVSYVFRFVRMYSLWMVLCLWGIYFLYLALTARNHFRKENFFTHFIVSCMDYNLLYAALAILFLGFACLVHINAFVIFLGAAVFIFFQAITKREKRYVIVSVLIFWVLLSFKIPIVYNNISFIASLRGIIIEHTKIDEFLWHGYSLLKHYERNYFNYFFVQIGNKTVTVIGILALLCVFFEKKYEVGKAYLGYLVSIVITGVVFFVLLADRYFEARYVMYLMIGLDVLLAIGMDYLFSQLKAHTRVIFFIGLASSLLFHAYSGREIYKQNDCGNFIPAYEKMLAAADKEETVPIISAQFQGYYYNQVSTGYKSDILDMVASEISYDTITEFAEKYPVGFIAIDDNKIGQTKGPIFNFAMYWTDKIAGDNLDDYAVQISRYHIIEPENDLAKIYPYENEYMYFNYTLKEDTVEWDILWKEESVPEDVGLICLHMVQMENEVNENIHAVQLKVKPGNGLQYHFSVPREGKTDICKIDPIFAYFTEDGEFKERKIEY